MAYERVNWENLPSTKTPVNADNLNKMDKVINSKQDKLTAGTGIEITGENIINNLNANYSTEEQRVGTWIDGKPLYRKVYDGIVLSRSEIIVDTISGIDVKMIYGWLVRESVSFIQPFGSYVAMDTTSTSRVFYGSPYIKVQAGADYQTKNTTARVIVEYTKTTD